MLGMAPYDMQAAPAPARKPLATSPGRLVGVTIGFGVLALILGYLTLRYTYLGKFFIGIEFGGWELAGLLYWLGLMRSLTKPAGRVVGELLVVALGYVLVTVLPVLASMALLFHRFIPPYILYNVRIIGPILLLTALFCWGFVSLAGTWQQARRAGLRPLPVFIYPLVIVAAFLPSFLRFVVYDILPVSAIHLPYYLYFGPFYYFFVALAVVELVLFTVLGSLMVWFRLRRVTNAPASVPPVTAPAAAASIPPGIAQ